MCAYLFRHGLFTISENSAEVQNLSAVIFPNSDPHQSRKPSYCKVKMANLIQKVFKGN